MPHDKKNGTVLPDISAMKEIFARAMARPSGKKILVFTDGDINDDPSGILAHEMPHRMPGTGVGKTEMTKKIAEAMGGSVITIDASQLTSPGDLDKFFGAPPGYQGYKPTPEQEAGIAVGMAELKEQWRLRESRESGEALAASCHSGVTQETSCLKPVRFKNKSGFIAFGMMN